MISSKSYGAKKQVFFLITIPKGVAFLQLPCALLLFLMNEARFGVEACTRGAVEGTATEFSICKFTLT